MQVNRGLPVGLMKFVISRMIEVSNDQEVPTMATDRKSSDDNSQGGCGFAGMDADRQREIASKGGGGRP